MENFGKNILETMVWYDMFEYPLTLDEIFWWQYGAQNSRGEIEEVINGQLLDQIEVLDGYYFLRGRKSILATRQARQGISKEKMKRVRVLQQFLKYFPFIRMVAVCNVLGYMNSYEKDDIDLFIVTAKNRLWSARLWLTGVLKILNLRPKLRTGEISDKFCLSFWVTEDNMDLEGLQIDNDIYLRYWLANLRPIHDEGNYFREFLSENKWVENFVPKVNEYYGSIVPLSHCPIVNNVFKRFFERIQPRWLEKLYKNFQMIWTRKLRGGGVIIRDNILKGHLIDRRQEFKDRFETKVSQLL